MTVNVEGGADAIRPLTIGSRNAAECGALSTDVLSSQVTNPGSGSGGTAGILPRTGAGIALLLRWAMILIALGTLLSLAGWQCGQRFEPVRAFGARVRRKRGSVALLPATQVPFVDTSRFQPYRSRYTDSVQADAEPAH